MKNFLEKYWLWILLGLAALWFFKAKKQQAPTGSAATPISNIVAAFENTIAGLSAQWAKTRNDLGLV